MVDQPLRNIPPLSSFVGRVRELETLERVYASGQSQFFPIYGRRRIGKTELILHFLRGKPALFYHGKLAPADLQIAEFLEAAAVALDEPLLGEIQPETWKKALQLVTSRIPRDKKLVLVLDEFQWIAEKSPELPSILQELWDTDWSRTGQVFLILCGSYLGFMEREVLGKKSPLFGRRTGQIKLEPFDFREATAFHPRLSHEEQARTWFLCGGIPYYLRQFNSEHSTATNIQRTLLAADAPLFREAEFLIREELREVDRYHSIIMTLARGSLPPSEIAKRASIPQGNIQYYLNTLTELGYVERRYPLTEGTPVARFVRFTLTDPLLLFWFRFVFPHFSQIIGLHPAEAYRQIIQPEIDSYFGARFEQLCRSAIGTTYADAGIDTAFTVGEYWSKDTQVDVVSIRRDQRIDLGECKWGTIRSWPAVQRELDTRIQQYPNPNNRTISGIIFSRKPPTRKQAASLTARVISLLDLYGKRS